MYTRTRLLVPSRGIISVAYIRAFDTVCASRVVTISVREPCSVFFFFCFFILLSDSGRTSENNNKKKYENKPRAPIIKYTGGLKIKSDLTTDHRSYGFNIYYTHPHRCWSKHWFVLRDHPSPAPSPLDHGTINHNLVNRTKLFFIILFQL